MTKGNQCIKERFFLTWYNMYFLAPQYLGSCCAKEGTKSPSVIFLRYAIARLYCCITLIERSHHTHAKDIVLSRDGYSLDYTYRDTCLRGPK